MVKLRDLAEANKKDGDVLLSNTPQKLTTEIKEKVFKNKLPVDVVDDSQMVTTTQFATCPECKKKTGCDCNCTKRIIVDYK